MTKGGFHIVKYLVALDMVRFHVVVRIYELSSAKWFDGPGLHIILGVM